MTNSISDRFDDNQILSLRGRKNLLDPHKPYAYLVEKEYSSSGQLEDAATIFLTNSECPFRCLMCDLWKNTTDEPVKIGDIPRQISWALERMPSANHVKLYNSGNFFDRNAIPPEDHAEIADLLSGFRTVTVEAHPKLINGRCLEFESMLRPDLEVAIGLETVHPDILPALNKRMDLTEFENAVGFLKSNGIRTRSFILLKTPYMTEQEGIIWAKKSTNFAFNCGVDCCVVIPIRSGNGAIDKLQAKGLFSEPNIDSLEEVLAYGIGLRAGRVFADLWDIDRFSTCNSCLNQRRERMNEMNLAQKIFPEVVCDCNS